MVFLVKVEGTLDELKAIFGEGAKKAGGTVKSSKRRSPSPKTAKKTTRAPSAYNKHMKKELARLKKKHPKTPHSTLFKRAAKSWKGSKKKGGKK